MWALVVGVGVGYWCGRWPLVWVGWLCGRWVWLWALRGCVGVGCGCGCESVRGRRRAGVRACARACARSGRVRVRVCGLERGRGRGRLSLRVRVRVRVHVLVHVRNCVRVHHVEWARGDGGDEARDESGCERAGEALLEDPHVQEATLDLIVGRELGGSKRRRAAACRADAFPQAQHALLLNNGDKGVDHACVPLWQKLPVGAAHLAVSLQTNLEQIGGVGGGGGDGAGAGAGGDLLPQRDLVLRRARSDACGATARIH
eukprot:6185056-Pleurochrysis_carterae.AAC.1